MAFRFDRDESVSVGVQRMARTQINAALIGLADPESQGVADTIFDVRKRCKKARAIIRLVRQPLGEKRYRRANVAYRDVGRILSGHRDAEAAAAAFESLLLVAPDALSVIDVASIRAGLLPPVDEAEAALAAIGPSLGTAEDLLLDAADRIARWRMKGEGWELLHPGVATVHGRGALAVARADGRSSSDDLHELRKQAKYTRYHLRMLRPLSPAMVLPLLAQFETVGDHLGQARDLALLGDVLQATPETFGGDGVVGAVVGAAVARQDELESAGLGLARRLYAEPSEAFATRLGRYWELWQAEGPEPQVVPVPPPLAPSAVQSEPEPIAEPGPEVEAPPGFDEFGELTLTRLRFLARERSIPGRSSMKREQLIEALRKGTPLD